MASYAHLAQGQTFNVSWVGTNSGFYSAASNWSTGTVPNNDVALGDFVNVTINRVGGTVVTMNFDPTLLNLTIGANAGNQLRMGDTRTLALIGASGGGAISLSNAGTISVGSTAAANAVLALNGTSTNIGGAGTIELLGTSSIIGTGTVTSNNTIIGTGNLGNNAIAFINNGTVTASGGSLTLDARASGGFDNNGLLQALAGGTMVFSGNGGGSFTNVGATISVAAPTGRINLLDGATIFGGTIQTAGLNTSIFFVPGSQSATLDSVTSTADVNVGVGATLSLAGTITNNSRIRTNSSLGVATYNLGAGTVTLSGTGSLVLSQLAGAFGNLIGTGTLINSTTHTIAGAGTIGNNTQNLVNHGTISANLNGQLLAIDPGTTAVSNNGTLEARNGGTLRLVGPTFFTNSGGNIVATDATSVVELTNGVQIASGELRGAGTIRVPSATNALITGSTNSARVEVANNATLDIGATFTNTGTISLLAGANATGLEANLAGGTMTLAGGGTVILSGAQARLSAAGGGTFVNNANTIRGQGAIGLGSMAVNNAGTISADVASAILFIEPSSQGMINTGTLEARNAGKMFLSGDSGGVINNNAGTLKATELNSSITLSDGVVLNGGTLITAPANTGVNVQFGGSATVNNVNNRGRMVIQDGGTMNVGGGGMLNDGTVVISSAALTSHLMIDGGTATFSGAGRVQMAQESANAILGGTGTLVNALGHRITGEGLLGNNTLAMRNLGLIDANVEGGVLIMDNGLGSWVNSGTMQASNDSTLELNGTGGGVHLENTGGRIIANDRSNVRLNGLSIDGGTLATVGSGTISTSPASTATIGFLSHTGKIVVGGNNAVLKIDGFIANDGTISIEPGPANQSIVQMNSFSTLNNNGTILLHADGEGSTPIFRGTLKLNNNGLIRGDGVLDLDLGGSTFRINNAGAIEGEGLGLNIGSIGSPPPALVINNTGVIRTRAASNNAIWGTNVEVSGSGSIDIQANSAVLSFAKISTPSVTLNGALAQTGNPASYGNVDGAGTLVLGFSFIGGPVPGDVTLNRRRGLSVVAVQSGTLTTTAGGGTLGTSFVEGTLTIGSLGPARWNLTDHDLLLNYAGATALPDIQNYIASARNGGSWNGSGLTSTAARDNPIHNTTLGAIEASDFIAATGANTFSGQTIDGTAVLVKYTYYGDTDLNGIINFDDYSRTDAGFNNHRTGWFNGDFDYNDSVNFDDYALIDLAFNSQSGVLARAMSYLDGSDRSNRGMNDPALRLVQDHFAQFGNAYAASFINAVPEPTSAAVISGLAVSAASFRRRRRR